MSPCLYWLRRYKEPRFSFSSRIGSQYPANMKANKVGFYPDITPLYCGRDVNYVAKSLLFILTKEGLDSKIFELFNGTYEVENVLV